MICGRRIPLRAFRVCFVVSVFSVIDWNHEIHEIHEIHEKDFAFLCGKKRLGLLEIERAPDRIGLIPDRAKLVAITGKAKYVNSVVVRPEKVESPAHRSTGPDKFEIENRAAQATVEILVGSGDVARKKLQFLFLVADDVGQHPFLRDANLSDLEMPIVPVNKHVLDIRFRGRRLDGHLPAAIRHIECILSIRIAEHSCLTKRGRRPSEAKRDR